MIKKLLIFGLIVSVCVCFMGCQNTPVASLQPGTEMPTLQPTATPTSEVDMKDYSKKTLPATGFEGSVKVTGRTVMRQNALSLDWSLSGIEFQGWFDGEVSMSCNVMGGYEAYIRVMVDDNAETAERLCLDVGAADIKLVDVEKGYHNIKVIKLTEPGNSIIRVNSVTYCGELDDKPADGALKIEIIGDSITCGAGVLSTEAIPDIQYYTRDGDAFLAFSGMLARQMKADVNVVALSGWGVVQGGYTAEYCIPAIYEYTDNLWNAGEKWNFEVWQPDVVIISLGTNDYALADGRRDEFEQACGSFIKTVRNNNPDALIIWTYGMINNLYRTEINNAIAAQNDDKIVYAHMPANSAAGWGHPTVAFQQKYADSLKKIITDNISVK